MILILITVSFVHRATQTTGECTYYFSSDADAKLFISRLPKGCIVEKYRTDWVLSVDGSLEALRAMIGEAA